MAYQEIPLVFTLGKTRGLPRFLLTLGKNLGIWRPLGENLGRNLENLLLRKYLKIRRSVGGFSPGTIVSGV